MWNFLAKDREAFLKLLNDTEDWLYEEGEDVTKSVYIKKLEELKVCMNAHMCCQALVHTTKSIVLTVCLLFIETW